MVRFAIVIALLTFLGFMLWLFLPAMNMMTGVVNNTTGAAPVEVIAWKLMPLIIPAMLAIGIVWQYFSRHDENRPQ